MNLKNLYLTFLIALTFHACSNTTDYVYLDVSDFNIQNELLPIESNVQLLSFSGKTAENENIDYFIHFIIVEEESQDTFNLLTIDATSALADEDQRMQLISEEHFIYQDVFKQFKEDMKRPEKVAVDKNFVIDTKNDFPTVIGILVTKTSGKKFRL